MSNINIRTDDVTKRDNLSRGFSFLSSTNVYVVVLNIIDLIPEVFMSQLP